MTMTVSGRALRSGPLLLRDQRELMERPFFALSKQRLGSIDYRSPDGALFVRVEAGAAGMATIWDADVLLWATSMLAERLRRGEATGAVIEASAGEMLADIGRAGGGSQYARLRAALTRLAGTRVVTNVRRDGDFHWLEDWSLDRGRLRLVLPQWFAAGVAPGNLLAVDRAYLGLTGGLARWLWRVARKHGGQPGGPGFAMALPTLWKKSGSAMGYREFKRELLKVGELPGMAVALEDAGGGEPKLRVRRVAARPAAAPMPVRAPAVQAVPPLSGRPLAASARTGAAKPVGGVLADALAALRQAVEARAA